MDFTILTVTQLNNYIRRLLEQDEELLSIAIRGELSNYKIHSSGHHYFSVKDSESTLRCVMFKSSAMHLRFRPENGMKVILFGKVSVYTRDGVYQLYCTNLIPDGLGELQAAFEQLKQRLSDEGLFDPSKKKPIPAFPKRIALVTSPTGAAVQDMIRILRKRWPLSSVLIVPSLVQGPDAPESISEALSYVNTWQLADLIIVGRGGGSLEDLWAFNTETVARAICSSSIPVISAVGHEPDVTIADYVADLRAATPSHAAECAVPDRSEESRVMDGLFRQINSRIDRILQEHSHAVRDRKKALTYLDPAAVIRNSRLDLDRSYDRMTAVLQNLLRKHRQELLSKTGMIRTLDPRQILTRGFSIVTKEEAVVDSAFSLAVNDTVRIRFKDGQASCLVREIQLQE